MNLKSISLLLLLSCFIKFQANAQVIVDTENYGWSEKPVKIPVNKIFADASAVTLKDVRIINYYYSKVNGKDELQSELIEHEIVQINDDRGIESYNKLYIPLSSVIEVLEVKARTIAPDGTINVLDKSKMKELQNKDGDGAYKIFAFEGLQKGSVLEYWYKVKKEPEYSLRARIQGSYPVQLQQFYIISPENLKFECKFYNGTAKYQDSVNSEVRYMYYTVENIPGRTEEKYSAYKASLMRFEVQLAYNSVSGKARILTYNSAAQRTYPVLFAEDAKVNKKLLKFSDDMGWGRLEKEDKVKHIENFIKTTIEETKERNPDYGDVSKILQNKIGTETGITKTYINLFRVNNIPVQLVYTTDRNSVAFDPDFECWNYLDKTLLYLPDFDAYIDPGNIALRYPFISPVYTLNSALFLEEVAVGSFKSATASVKVIPAPDVSKSNEVIDAYCKFNSRFDSVDLKINRSYLGMLAANSRFLYHYAQKDQKTKMLDEMMRTSMADGKIISEEIKNYDFLESDKPLEFNGEVMGTALLEKSGTDILFKVGDVIGPQTQLYQEKERQSDIDIFFAHQFKRTIKVEIPQGFKASGLEALNMSVKFDYQDKPACGFVSSYQVNNNVITINVLEYYSAIQLPRQKFDDFTKVINAAADFNKINLVFEKL